MEGKIGGDGIDLGIDVKEGGNGINAAEGVCKGRGIKVVIFTGIGVSTGIMKGVDGVGTIEGISKDETRVAVIFVGIGVDASIMEGGDCIGTIGGINECKGKVAVTLQVLGSVPVAWKVERQGLPEATTRRRVARSAGELVEVARERKKAASKE